MTEILSVRNDTTPVPFGNCEMQCKLHLILLNEKTVRLTSVNIADVTMNTMIVC